MRQEEYNSTEYLVQVTAQKHQCLHLYSALFLFTNGRVTTTAVRVTRANNRKTNDLEHARGDKRWCKHQPPLTRSSTRTWPRSYRLQTAGTSWEIAQYRLHEMGKYLFPQTICNAYIIGTDPRRLKSRPTGENLATISEAFPKPWDFRSRLIGEKDRQGHMRLGQNYDDSCIQRNLPLRLPQLLRVLRILLLYNPISYTHPS